MDGVVVVLDVVGGDEIVTLAVGTDAVGAVVLGFLVQPVITNTSASAKRDMVIKALIFKFPPY